jgi:hypothetical protein
VQDLFHSTSQVRVLRCGHTLHKKCLERLLKREVAMHTCPLCSKTLVDHSFQWKQMDLALASTPMPEEYRNKSVAVLCNDCGSKGLVPFHVFGFKCPNAICGGYNTRQIMEGPEGDLALSIEGGQDEDGAAASGRIEHDDGRDAEQGEGGQGGGELVSGGTAESERAGARASSEAAESERAGARASSEAAGGAVADEAGAGAEDARGAPHGGVL